MSTDRDVTRIVRSWLDEGATQLPDRVLDNVLDLVPVTPQRRAWWPARRFREMNNALKLAIAAAAVVAVAVVGINLLPRQGVIGDPGPTATPTPSPSPTTPLPPRNLPDGPLAAGTYVAHPFSPPNSTIAITFTVPDNWEGFGGWALYPATGTGPPDGIGLGFLRADGLFSDPCQWDQTGPDSVSSPQEGDIDVGPTVEDLATALGNHTAYESTTPTPVTLGGFTGVRMDLQLPSDVDLTTCSRGAYFVWGTLEPAGNDLYAQGPGQRWRLWILDVDGFRLVVVNDDYAATSERLRSEAQAIIDSMQIQP